MAARKRWQHENRGNIIENENGVINRRKRRRNIISSMAYGNEQKYQRK